jgi:hypothetical protein
MVKRCFIVRNAGLARALASKFSFLVEAGFLDSTIASLRVATRNF